MPPKAPSWIAGTALTAIAIAIAIGLFARRHVARTPDQVPSMEASAAPRAADSAPPPCARYRPANTRVRWACFDNGAPVDLVTEQSLIVAVLPSAVQVLILDSEPLDPKIPIADPSKPPVPVCVLDKPSAGFSGFVAFTALHDRPCAR